MGVADPFQGSRSGPGEAARRRGPGRTLLGDPGGRLADDGLGAHHGLDGLENGLRFGPHPAPGRHRPASSTSSTPRRPARGSAMSTPMALARRPPRRACRRSRRRRGWRAPANGAGNGAAELGQPAGGQAGAAVQGRIVGRRSRMARGPPRRRRRQAGQEGGDDLVVGLRDDVAPRPPGERRLVGADHPAPRRRARGRCGPRSRAPTADQRRRRPSRGNARHCRTRRTPLEGAHCPRTVKSLRAPLRPLPPAPAHQPSSALAASSKTFFDRPSVAAIRCSSPCIRPAKSGLVAPPGRQRLDQPRGGHRVDRSTARIWSARKR